MSRFTVKKIVLLKGGTVGKNQSTHKDDCSHSRIRWIDSAVEMPVDCCLEPRPRGKLRLRA